MRRFMQMAAGAVAAAVLLSAVQAASAGPVGGTIQTDPLEVGPRKFVSLPMTCVGQQRTRVSVTGVLSSRDPIGSDDPSEFDGREQIRLQVFDAAGEQVAVDVGANPSVSFTPKETGKYRIQATNLSHDRPVVCRITAE